MTNINLGNYILLINNKILKSAVIVFVGVFLVQQININCTNHYLHNKVTLLTNLHFKVNVEVIKINHIILIYRST